jgi:hypothetical protein
MMANEREDNRDYHLAEQKSLRNEIDNCQKRWYTYIFFVMLASGAFWSWLATRPMETQATRVAGFLPIVFALCGWRMSRNATKNIFLAAEYTRRIENKLLSGSQVGGEVTGWENFLKDTGRKLPLQQHNKPVVRDENTYWGVLSILALAGGIYFCFVFNAGFREGQPIDDRTVVRTASSVNERESSVHSPRSEQLGPSHVRAVATVPHQQDVKADELIQIQRDPLDGATLGVHPLAAQLDWTILITLLVGLIAAAFALFPVAHMRHHELSLECVRMRVQMENLHEDLRSRSNDLKDPSQQYARRLVRKEAAHFNAYLSVYARYLHATGGVKLATIGCITTVVAAVCLGFKLLDGAKFPAYLLLLAVIAIAPEVFAAIRILVGDLRSAEKANKILHECFVSERCTWCGEVATSLTQTPSDHSGTNVN